MHLRRLLAAALCASALTACSDDPEPVIADPSPTPTVASTPTQTPTLQAWEEKTEDGAVAFVKHWTDEFNNMQLTGATEDFKALGTADCQACKNFVELTDDVYASGGKVQSNGWTVSRALMGTGQDLSHPQLAVRFRQSAETISFGDGRPSQSNPSGSATFVMTLAWQQGSWHLDKFEVPS